MTKTLFSCADCARRALYAVNGGIVPPLLRTRDRHTPFTASRPLSTATEVVTATKSDAPRKLDTSLENADPTIAKKKEAEKMKRNISESLQYLGEDPFHIAQHVKTILQKDRIDEAYQLVQKASQKKQMTVAWNHLISYLLETQQLKKAIKVYNDMKKRAQFPNVQTYTVIFRGLAKSQHPKLAVAEAVKHYSILMNDKRLEPNSIHLNAVLNVCAKAGDLDSMFLIVNSVNEGTRAPTAYTYTTILNALRHSSLNESKSLPKEQHLANVKQSIDRSKTLWTEVVRRWKNGRLIIDEELVCAMGRVLLLHPTTLGKREVFDLIEQTMQVPNLLKAGSTAEKETTSESPKPSQALVASNSKGVHAVPSCNTLALVLTALASSKEIKTGVQYWEYFTRDQAIVPDKDNWLRLLGMLKVARSSAQAASMIDLVPPSYIEATHFRIGMDACLRDNINPNVSKHANHILDSMLERLPYPDLQAMRLFLEVALSSHYQFRQLASSGQADEGKRAYGVQITEALARLWKPYRKIHHHYWEVARPRDDKHAKQIYNEQREVISLARKMVSAFNKVLNEGMLRDKDLAEMRPLAAKLNREIQDFYANREVVEPNLRPGAAPAAVEDEQLDPAEEEEEARKQSELLKMEHTRLNKIRPWVTYKSVKERLPEERENKRRSNAKA